MLSCLPCGLATKEPMSRDGGRSHCRREEAAAREVDVPCLPSNVGPSPECLDGFLYRCIAESLRDPLMKSHRPVGLLHEAGKVRLDSGSPILELQPASLVVVPFVREVLACTYRVLHPVLPTALLDVVGHALHCRHRCGYEILFAVVGQPGQCGDKARWRPVIEIVGEVNISVTLKDLHDAVQRGAYPMPGYSIYRSVGLGQHYALFRKLLGALSAEPLSTYASGSDFCQSRRLRSVSSIAVSDAEAVSGMAGRTSMWKLL